MKPTTDVGVYMQAYCFKCKTKRKVQDPQPVFTINGTPATQGTCPVCGTRMFKMGRTPAHEGLDPAEHTVVSSKAKAKLAAIAPDHARDSAAHQQQSEADQDAAAVAAALLNPAPPE